MIFPLSSQCIREVYWAPAAQKSAPKEHIDENKLKKTEEEAVAITEENHKLRKEIFEAKNKLGISTAPASEE